MRRSASRGSTNIFLYALPDDYEKMMPRQVLLYFSYECAHLDQKSRAALYANVAAYIPQDDPLYKKYEREMEKFAMEQLSSPGSTGDLR